MYDVIELRPRRSTGAAEQSAVCPQEISYVDFNHEHPKVTKFAHGSRRAQLFSELEDTIGSNSPLGKLLAFFRDRANVNIEFLLWLVRWSHFLDATVFNRIVIDELIAFLHYAPQNNFALIAAHEDWAWLNKKANGLGVTRSELAESCFASFNPKQAQETEACNEIWILYLIILHAYRKSAALNRPPTIRQRFARTIVNPTRLFLLRTFATTKWAREVSDCS